MGFGWKLFVNGASDTAMGFLAHMLTLTLQPSVPVALGALLLVSLKDRKDAFLILRKLWYLSYYNLLYIRKNKCWLLLWQIFGLSIKFVADEAGICFSWVIQRGFFGTWYISRCVFFVATIWTNVLKLWQWKLLFLPMLTSRCYVF